MKSNLKSIKNTRKPKSSPRGATQGDGPAYQGQVSFRVPVPAGVSPQTTTVTTGVIANSIAIDAAAVTGFATRFGATFDEYRILGCDARVTALSVSTGLTNFWWDEKSASAPTGNEAFERVMRRVSNNSANPESRFTMRWRARDLLDLQYTPIGTTNTIPVYFKVYTDSGNFNAPVAVTPLFFVEFILHFEFRGLRST